MNQRKKHPFSQARAFILEILRKREKMNDFSRLPSIRKMAVQCGVASRTMWSAAGQLAKEGRITVVPGGGILPLPQDRQKQTHDDSALAEQPSSLEGLGIPRWEKLRYQIARDIRAGRFPTVKGLPACKELKNRYGVCHATLNKALTALVNDRVLELRNRGYVIRHTGRAKQKSTLVLLAQTASLTNLRYSSPRIPPFWHALEQECVRRNLHLEIQHLPYLSSDDSCNAGSQFPTVSSRRPVMGYVLAMQSSSLEYTTSLVSHLSDLGKPVAILDEDSGKATPQAWGMQNKPFFRIFGGSPAEPGEIVGEALLEHGHRFAAGFQPAARTKSSIGRIQGLRRAFVRTGLSGSCVSAFSPEGIEEGMQIDQRILNWNKIRAPEQDPILTSELVSLCDPFINGDLLFHSGNRLRLWGQYLFELFEPQFAAALHDPRITAWVMDNDVTGLLALHYLKEKGIQVPHQISVVGFDDTTAALVAGLSSYNFNMHAVALAILEHILPLDPRKRRTASEEPVNVPGYLVRRLSLGPAPDVSANP